ncbi:MAG: alanine--glyoxylate aminotransferase family protein [Flavobacteriales bacterium]|nr:alanine--glyoxylate aminotransferase family protein [Flavobacteriales bacterium]
MGPGPTQVYPSVLESLSMGTIGHLDPQFIQMMDEVKEMLHGAFQTKNTLTMVVSAPGSAGMETCFVNLVEDGDKVIICQNGVFGGRMKENVERYGGVAVMVEDDWGTSISLDKAQAAIDANPDAKIFAFVHAETSTGVLSDAEALCKMAKDAGMLTIMDAVTSLGGLPVKIDEWGVDAVYSGSQKCLACVPGLSPISLSPAAVAKIEARTSKVKSWFMDLNLVMAYWGGTGKRSYHHTAPVNALFGLHEALRLFTNEGADAVFARHLACHERLKAGLTELGLTFFVAESDRLPQCNVINIPEGVDDLELRTKLLNDHQLEIGGGLGPMAGKIWRIGLMGGSATEENVDKCLAALKAELAPVTA